MVKTRKEQEEEQEEDQEEDQEEEQEEDKKNNNKKRRRRRRRRTLYEIFAQLFSCSKHASMKIIWRMVEVVRHPQNKIRKVLNQPGTEWI